jgi:hypothetical protein
MIGPIKNGWIKDMCKEAATDIYTTTCLFENIGGLDSGSGYSLKDDEREMKKSADC